MRLRLLLLLRRVPGSELLILHKSILEWEIDRQCARWVMHDVRKVRRQGVLRDVERYTVRQMMRLAVMCELRLQMLWEAR